jgi:integrase
VIAVFRKLLDKPGLDLKRGELQLAADAWRSGTTASFAVRALRPCLAWAEQRELVPEDVGKLKPRAKIGKRERVVTPEELKAIWPHLRGAHGDVIRWLLLTGCRLNEAAGMTWGEIATSEIKAVGSNTEGAPVIWSIPATRAKNGKARSIPLPRQAVALLAARRAADTSGEGVDKLVFPSRVGSVLGNWQRENKRLYGLSGTSAWHRHDLRRTVATMLGDLRFAPHVIKAAMGHTIAEGVTAVYARSKYTQEHRQALQALADEIDRIVTGVEDIGNVVPFAARA